MARLRKRAAPNVYVYSSGATVWLHSDCGDARRPGPAVHACLGGLNATRDESAREIGLAEQTKTPGPDDSGSPVAAGTARDETPARRHVPGDLHRLARWGQ